MPFFLAIDAGGTKTQSLLADHDRVLARASTGSVKLMRVSEPEATARLHAMLDELAAAANVPLTQITATCIGLAGLTIPAVRAWATQALTSKVSGQLLLLGDEEIALDAAFRSGPGILAIAGTGSNIVGRAPSGSLHHAGGWGSILGDEGSGYWIGLHALRAALRAHDHEGTPSTSVNAPHAPILPSSIGHQWAPQSPPTATPSAQLLTAILQHWDLPNLPTLIDYGNHRGDALRPAPDFAALTPIVARLAQPDPAHPPNPIAAAILHQAGTDLADQITLVALKLQSATPSNLDPSASNLEIAFTGSVVTHVTPVRDAMVARLAVTLPHARVHSTPADPLEGALYRARNARLA